MSTEYWLKEGSVFVDCGPRCTVCNSTTVAQRGRFLLLLQARMADWKVVDQEERVRTILQNITSDDRKRVSPFIQTILHLLTCADTPENQTMIEQNLGRITTCSFEAQLYAAHRLIAEASPRRPIYNYAWGKRLLERVKEYYSL